MKKVIILNGSPRKIFNTAQLLKEVQKGAESTGAEVEYFNLYDYNFLGCRSCFACQRKGSTTNRTELPNTYTHIIEKDGISVCDIVSVWNERNSKNNIVDYNLDVKNEE